MRSDLDRLGTGLRAARFGFQVEHLAWENHGKTTSMNICSMCASAQNTGLFIGNQVYMLISSICIQSIQVGSGRDNMDAMCSCYRNKESDIETGYADLHVKKRDVRVGVSSWPPFDRLRFNPLII